MDIVAKMAPLIFLQLILTIAALVDISRRPRVTGDNKLIWVLVVIFISTFGPIIYFIFGRSPQHAGDSDS